MKKQSSRTTKRESTTVPSVEKDLEEDKIDSDDEAPEAVSFNQGRKDALESISNALQDLQRVKLKAKEKRRERDKLLKEQKQKKKVSLSKARLPPELLDQLTEQQDLTLEHSERSEDQQQTGDQTDCLRQEDEDSDLDDLDDSDREEDPSTIQVIQTSKVHHPPPNEAALQFLQKQLYGARIPRESMAKNISRKLKRLGKPGVNFHQKKSPEVKKNKKKGKVV